ncbi:MAG: hypothetical protein F6K50_12250 [Moorea sp. SIO3I7]|uniref:Fe2OG dioxygenase domain-containing protein n=2 Tax=Moorena TaxID=1155738 RepID=A0A1U7MXC1_9CYAN|nr:MULTISPECIES: 2OG-Fe(II) oxygenase [Moorena]NEN96277.1 hypothetical protein [Moorena sp. SIO3I7]NEO46650.1 hypothetical protein [Moorena sp. SIO4A3]NEO24332.1 hypothetical protein [Moorena sp. SIO4A5]NEP26481.1 hypothetical protein [Moorena sp. SIO3I6]OLT58340.1 hypothetical protein BJP37_04050 [Moorena bouillonii PNG]
MYTNLPKLSSLEEASNLVNLDRYPLDRLSSDRGKVLIADCQRQLDDTGCCLLPEFINSEALELFKKESEKLSVHAHYSNMLANVYFSEDDESLPKEHPKRFFFNRTSGFVRADSFPTDSLILQLYNWPAFAPFIQACLKEEKLYKYADPLSYIAFNVIKPGQEFPWHFDNNHVSVTVITQAPEKGGIFEYCHNIRSSHDENHDGVMKVLKGDRTPVTSLNLRPGDLQIFKGRYSLHRVTKVEGSIPRYTAVFSYTKDPQMYSKVYRSLQLYGKALPTHYQLDKTDMRTDGLED